MISLLINSVIVFLAPLLVFLRSQPATLSSSLCFCLGPGNSQMADWCLWSGLSGSRASVASQTCRRRGCLGVQDVQCRHPRVPSNLGPLPQKLFLKDFIDLFARARTSRGEGQTEREKEMQTPR